MKWYLPRITFGGLGEKDCSSDEEYLVLMVIFPPKILVFALFTICLVVDANQIVGLQEYSCLKLFGVLREQDVLKADRYPQGSVNVPNVFDPNEVVTHSLKQVE
ncbi:hypothetical protein ACLOJK_011078 [Asimina triloba]